MHVILNGEQLEEVDCFKNLVSQVIADGGCERNVVHRMNEGYRAWGAMKSVLSSSSSSSSSSSRSSQDRLIGPLPAKCWPEAFHATFIHNIQRKGEDRIGWS